MEAHQQAAERNEAITVTLHQAAESHKLAQQAITELQSQLNAYQHLQQTIGQVQARLDALEAILKDSASVAVSEGTRAGLPQQDTDHEAEPLSKRLRALNWKADER